MARQALTSAESKPTAVSSALSKGKAEDQAEKERHANRETALMLLEWTLQAEPEAPPVILERVVT